MIRTSLLTLALLGSAAAAAASPVPYPSPAATDRVEIVLASIAGGNPADLVYRP